jgi:predicted O-methyltransferase YrrM
MMPTLLERVGRRVRRAAVSTYMPVLRAQDQGTIGMIGRQGRLGAKLAAAIGDTVQRRQDDSRIARIEAGRERMRRDLRPLVDGSLGPGTSHDQTETISSACGRSKAARRALLLYNLAAAFRPRRILELGTNVGISSAYLRAGQGAEGSLITMEASPYRLRLARALHAEVGLDGIEYVEGLFADTLGATLEHSGSIDMAFIDGHHQYQPTLDYFEAIARKAAPTCVYVFDDVRWSDGMMQAWEELQDDNRFALTADLKWIGIGISDAEASGITQHRMPVMKSVLW